MYSDDFGDSKVDDGNSKLKSSKSSSRVEDKLNQSIHSHHSHHSHHSRSHSHHSSSHSRSPSRKSHMSESKFEESKDDDAPSYTSKRTQLISRISEYKTILTEEQQKDIESNTFLNKNEKWKYSLLTKTAEKRTNGSLSARSVNRSQSAKPPLSARSTTDKKPISTQEYVEKLAIPNKIVNNKRDTLDLYERVKKIKCTCKNGPCKPLKPGPGCARAKYLYATESEIRECTFKPKITKYELNEGKSNTDFVDRMDNQTRTQRNVYIFLIIF